MAQVTISRCLNPNHKCNHLYLMMQRLMVAYHGSYINFDAEGWINQPPKSYIMMKVSRHEPLNYMTIIES